MLKNKFAAILSLLVLFAVVLGCGGGKPDMPPESEIQTLVKTSTADFANAIEKEDFNAFRETVSNELKTQFSNDQMKTTFKSFIDNKEDVVPVLRDASKKDAKFSTPPAMREEKGYYILVTNGSFDTQPVATKFTNEYVWQDSKWKLLKININL